MKSLMIDFGGYIMNIKDIDLLKISEKVLRDDLSQNDISVVNNILFCIKYDLPKKCDAIMVLGNPTCLEDRLPAALALWENYDSLPYFILSGGVIIDKLGMTESEAMKNACNNYGIEKNKILLENSSSTTAENIINCASLIKNYGHSFKNIIVVSSSTHIRRVMMNFQKYSHLYPENINIIPYSSISCSCKPKSWSFNDVSRKIVSTELRFIHEYIYYLNYPDFQI